MTKQEEIREGINIKSPIPQIINRALLQLLQDYDKYKLVVDGLSDGYVPLDEYLAQAITSIMIGLHSQGVVIKVDRELPELTENFLEELTQVGYVAVESLIKGEK